MSPPARRSSNSNVEKKTKRKGYKPQPDSILTDTVSVVSIPSITKDSHGKAKEIVADDIEWQIREAIIRVDADERCTRRFTRIVLDFVVAIRYAQKRTQVLQKILNKAVGSV